MQITQYSSIIDLVPPYGLVADSGCCSVKVQNCGLPIDRCRGTEDQHFDATFGHGQERVIRTDYVVVVVAERLFE